MSGTAVPRFTDATERTDVRHLVEFYEDDERRAAGVAGFLVEGLAIGEPLLVIATEAHHEGISAELAARGIDAARLATEGRLVSLDAAKVLEEILDGSMTDRERFHALFERAVEALRRSGHTLPAFRVYGEVVDLLCGAGNVDAALHLEELWAEVGTRYSFTLLCGYSMSEFETAARRRSFDEVCSRHTDVVTEYRNGAKPESHPVRRELARLRQRSRALEAEMADRERLEEQLRLLADASAAIGSSLDHHATLATLCRMCVPRLADWAWLDLKVDGAIKRIAIAHTDSSKVAFGELLWDLTYASTHHGPGHGAPAVFRSGQSELLRDVNEDVHLESLAERELVVLVRGLGIRSSICVPLRDGDEVVGVLTLLSAESGRRFDGRDLGLAEELARRAGAATTNARLYQAAQTATRMKDEFLATVSHELRTPLNAILGWARMLRSGNVGPDKIDRALDAIERNSLAQAQLIDDLLDVSRIISGKLRLDTQPLSLLPVIAGAIDSVQPALLAKNIALEQQIDPNAGPIVADAHRIQQVIWNLLSNAAKFTPRGGSVRLVVERVDGSVVLTVTDSGQGFPKEITAAIFAPFKQADGSSARVHGGLGLGLAIVRHIVELHGGTIEAHSDGVGRGATFVVRLPISPATPTIVGPFRHHLRDPSSGKFERPVELQGLTVLVVDDERDTRDLLCEVLQQCGCSVLGAASAAEGLAVLDQATPRVAVCDIGMPGTDGYGFIESVRKRSADKGGRIVAVALTAYAGAEDRRRALRAGFQMHLAKPVEPAEFVAVLANLAQLAIAAT